MSEIKIIVFQLNGEVCAIDSCEVREILKYESIEKIENAPEYINGLYNLRGTYVPVVNLNKKFKLGDLEENKKTKIITSVIKGEYIGFVVNDVLEIATLTESNIENVPNIVFSSEKSYADKIAKIDDRIIVILTVSDILSDKEFNEIIQIKDKQKIKHNS